MQVTVEDAGHVAGFVSALRAIQDSDEGAFSPTGSSELRQARRRRPRPPHDRKLFTGMAHSEFKGKIGREKERSPATKPATRSGGTLTEHLI